MKRSLFFILGVLPLLLVVVPVSAWLLVPSNGISNQETKTLLTAVQGDIVWEERFATSSPPARGHHALAYDSARGRTVLFGGWDGNRLSDTWEWDGTNWVQFFPANAPPARRVQALAYDSVRGVVVLFGGNDGSNLLNDTWEWTGINWVQRFPATKPSARSSYALAYDSARGRTVLFGGWDGNRLNDTWEWDGTNWVQRFPTTLPPVRNGHMLAYDSLRRRAVLFGGRDDNPMSDTWEWDGTNWMQFFPTNAPPARAYHALVYDSVRERTVLFGGADYVGPGPDYSPLDDIWEWDGVNWVKRFPAGTPPARYVHAMAYDSARGRTVLFGGWSSSFFDDTWEYGPTFILSVTPTTHIITPSASATFSISLTQGMVSSSVDLNLTGLPPGATKQFEPSSVTPPAQAVLTVTTSTTTPLGLYPLVIAGSRGGFTNTTRVTLTVTVPDFTLSPFPFTHTVYQYQDATCTVTLDATPLFTSPVVLDLTNAPGGTSSLFAPPAIAPGETATLTITTGLSAVTGTHTLVISGTGGGLTRTTGLTLTILPAAIELIANPATQTLYQNQSAIFTLSLDATPGIESPVTLTMGTLANTVSTLSSDVLWPGQSATLIITTGLSTLTNTHTLVITGLSSGLSDTTTLTLKVLAAAITMTAIPASQVIYQVQSTSYALALSATPGLTLPVTLNTDATPGIQSRLVPNILWPNETATLIVTSSLATTVGAYPMMITGTGTILSGTNHLAFTSTTQASLTVLPADFALEMIPFTHTAFQGETASFLVELTSATPGFAFPIALHVGGVPNGTPFSIMPSEIASGTQATLFITTTGETPLAYHELTITGTVGEIERSAGATLQVKARVFLPIIVKRWPPIPDVSVLSPIDNTDQDNFYHVTWASAHLADTYTLEEATDALFSDAQVVYQGAGLSWTVPNPGKTPDTYYYRVKAHNSWGDSPWSNIQEITIHPLFVGLQLRWDGEGYIRGSQYYDVGWHLERDLNGLTDADTVRSHNYNWYDPNPGGWDSETWDSYYSVSTGYFKTSSAPSNPSWKWHALWVLPYDRQFSDGQTVSIDDQAFTVSGPHSGYTAFGQPVEYWLLVNRDKFLYWDGGGNWTVYVHAGDITLWYDAANTRLLLHRDVLRREYYKGRLTSDTVQYVINLTFANSFPITGTFSERLGQSAIPTLTAFLLGYIEGDKMDEMDRRESLQVLGTGH